MKKCVRCGTELPDIAVFCKYCGARQCLDESLQNSGSNLTERYNRLNWEIIAEISKLGSTQLELFSEIDDLSQKLLGYSIDTLTDFFSNGEDNDYSNSKCPLYPEALSVLKRAKVKYEEWHSRIRPLLLELKAAILKYTGEDIDISGFDLDENFFNIPPNLNTSDLTEAIEDINSKLSDYFYDASDLLGEMGDKIEAVMIEQSDSK